MRNNDDGQFVCSLIKPPFKRSLFIVKAAMVSLPLLRMTLRHSSVKNERHCQISEKCFHRRGADDVVIEGCGEGVVTYVESNREPQFVILLKKNFAAIPFFTCAAAYPH